MTAPESALSLARKAEELAAKLRKLVPSVQPRASEQAMQEAAAALPILARAVIEAASLSPDERSVVGMWLSTHKWNKTEVDRHLYAVLERVAAADDSGLLSEPEKSP